MGLALPALTNAGIDGTGSGDVSIGFVYPPETPFSDCSHLQRACLRSGVTLAITGGRISEVPALIRESVDATYGIKCKICRETGNILARRFSPAEG